jgi:hypothetical protein
LQHAVRIVFCINVVELYLSYFLRRMDAEQLAGKSLRYSAFRVVSEKTLRYSAFRVIPDKTLRYSAFRVIPYKTLRYLVFDLVTDRRLGTRHLIGNITDVDVLNKFFMIIY